MNTYFDPEPGTISSDLSKVKGIISVNGEFTGYEFAIIIDSYGTIYKNETFFSNEDSRRIITLNSSIKSYIEEILIETPLSGEFKAYIVILFAWIEEMTSTEIGNKTIILEANYQKLAFDLGSIVIPGAIFLFCICFIFISVFGYRKYRKRQDIDIAGIDERLEQINVINKQYFT
ncbi:MAG: hypothetical protein ACXAC8_17315, partial [Candidatus Hodarchaeales archaeon]